MIARARNAILNAVKESTENYFNDMRNMISDERFDVDVLNEETEKKEQKFVDEFESIMEPTPSEISIKKEAERREDVQVGGEDENHSNKTLIDIQLLEEFSIDKAFLERIQSKVKDNNKLKEEVDSGLNFLIQRCWR